MELVTRGTFYTSSETRGADDLMGIKVLGAEKGESPFRRNGCMDAKKKIENMLKRIEFCTSEISIRVVGG